MARVGGAASGRASGTRTAHGEGRRAGGEEAGEKGSGQEGVGVADYLLAMTLSSYHSNCRVLVHRVTGKRHRSEASRVAGIFAEGVA